MPEANVSFSILMLVSVVCVVVLTIFICRLIVSVIKLTNNANIIATSVQKEIEPTLKELKAAAQSINSIANQADNKLQNAKASFASVLGLGAMVGGKVRSFSQGILKGISFGLGLFNKK